MQAAQAIHTAYAAKPTRSASAARATKSSIMSSENITAAEIYAGAALLLLSIGFLMVLSASLQVADVRYGSSLYFFKRHLVYLSMALVAGGLAYQLPLVWLRKLAWPALAMAFVVLLAVLLPGVGREVNGSVRWIAVGGITIQASELAKLGLLIFVADYIARRQDVLRTSINALVIPLAATGCAVLLLLAEPDFGTSLVLFSTVMLLLFVAGARLLPFLIIAVLGGMAATALAFAQPYRVKRLMAFVDPWADQFNSGYQLVQSLIAFGRGHWDGVGVGGSVQKLFYLPEAHTDFVVAVWAEETGLLGMIVLVVLALVLALSGLYVGKKALEKGLLFESYLALGATFLMAMQAFINMAVSVGLLPTKGLTFPLLSYGGSSLVVSVVMLALVLRVNKETQLHVSNKSKKAPALKRKRKGVVNA